MDPGSSKAKLLYYTSLLLNDAVLKLFPPRRDHKAVSRKKKAISFAQKENIRPHKPIHFVA
jgi:hypothetical protein